MLFALSFVNAAKTAKKLRKPYLEIVYTKKLFGDQQHNLQFTYLRKILVKHDYKVVAAGYSYQPYEYDRALNDCLFLLLFFSSNL